MQEEAEFILTPPEPVQVPTITQAHRALAPVAPEQRPVFVSQIAKSVDDFAERLSAADLNSEQFRSMLDRAFAAGRAEITDTSAFIAGNPFLGQVVFKDYDTTEGARALRELSGILAKANPKGQDLLGPITVFGRAMPFGNKLRGYLDNFKPMSSRMTELMAVLDEEEDDQRRDIAKYDVSEGQFFAKLRTLDRATEYLACLDKRLESEASALAPTNPEKARAVREEVLLYVRSNLRDVKEHKVLVVVAIGQIRQYRHTGRMTLLALSRIKTLGVDALAISQSVAIAAYNQKKRMELNEQVQAVVNDVVAGLGDTLESHTQRVIEFAKNPVLGISSLETSLDKTLGAIAKFNEFRSTVVDTLAADNEKLTALYEKAKTGMRIEQKETPPAYGDVFSL